MQVKYNQEIPAIGKDGAGNIVIWHNHSKNFDTSYLYKNLSQEEKMVINNKINEHKIDLKGCITFFGKVRDGKLGESYAVPGASAFASDEVRLESLTCKNI